MPEATVVQFQKKEEAKFICSACGADRGCQCNAPAVPKAVRAAEALKANPGKSDRSIAEQIGASPTTVGKAREELSSSGQLEDGPRTGLDGRVRKLPAREGDAEVSAEQRKAQYAGSFEDDTFQAAADVEEPRKVLANVLDSIKQSKAVAEAYRKILKASPFDREAKKEISDAIDKLISKWRSAQAVLTRPMAAEPAAPIVPADLSIPGFLRRDLPARGEP
jgi:DNA-binding Lrp family transcriptional regulator